LPKNVTESLILVCFHIILDITYKYNFLNSCIFLINKKQALDERLFNDMKDIPEKCVLMKYFKEA